MTIETGESVCDKVCRPVLKAIGEPLYSNNIDIYKGILKKIDSCMGNLESEIMVWIDDSH